MQRRRVACCGPAGRRCESAGCPSSPATCHHLVSHLLWPTHLDGRPVDPRHRARPAAPPRQVGPARHAWPRSDEHGPGPSSRPWRDALQQLGRRLGEHCRVESVCVCVCVECRAGSGCAGWADGYRSNSASLVASPCASPTTVPARKMTVTRHFAMRVEDRIMAGTYESTELALPQFDHATNQTVFQFDAQHMEELLNLTCTSPCSVFITQPTSPSCLAVFCK